jgi:hypothetical protein
MAEDPIKLFSTRAERYPKSDATDTTRSALEVAGKLVPIFGPITVELFARLITPGLERRREEWFRELATDLDALKARMDIEDLANDEAFVSAMIQATRIALSNHQESKRALLRKALVSIATHCEPDEDLQHIYLQLLDEFTPSHVTLLNFLWTGSARVATANGGELPQFVTYQEVLERFEPEFRGKVELVQQVIIDLNRRGLSTLQGAKLAFPQQVITNHGIAFLRFLQTNE